MSLFAASAFDCIEACLSADLLDLSVAMSFDVATELSFFAMLSEAFLAVTFLFLITAFSAIRLRIPFFISFLERPSPLAFFTSPLFLRALYSLFTFFFNCLLPLDLSNIPMTIIYIVSVPSRTL